MLRPVSEYTDNILHRILQGKGMEMKTRWIRPMVLLGVALVFGILTAAENASGTPVKANKTITVEESAYLDFVLESFTPPAGYEFESASASGEPDDWELMDCTCTPGLVTAGAFDTDPDEDPEWNFFSAGGALRAIGGGGGGGGGGGSATKPWWAADVVGIDTPCIILEIKEDGDEDDFIMGTDSAPLFVTLKGGDPDETYNITLSDSGEGDVNFSTTSLSFTGSGATTVTITGCDYGHLTITATCDKAESASIAAVVLPKIDHLEFQLPDGEFQDVPSAGLYVEKGTSVTFKAIPDPSDATWPEGYPVWSGAAGADGTGETISVTFNTASTSMSDTTSVIATAGTSTKTCDVVAWEDVVEKFDIKLTETNPSTLQILFEGKLWSPDLDGDGRPDETGGRVQLQAIAEEDTDGSTMAPRYEKQYANGEHVSVVFSYFDNIENDEPYSSPDYPEVASIVSPESREYYAAAANPCVVQENLLLADAGANPTAEVIAEILKIPLELAQAFKTELAAYARDGGKEALRVVEPSTDKPSTTIGTTKFTLSAYTYATVTNPAWWKFYAKEPRTTTVADVTPEVYTDDGGKPHAAEMTLHFNSRKAGFAGKKAWATRCSDSLVCSYPARTISVMSGPGIAHVAAWFANDVPAVGDTYRKTAAITVGPNGVDYTYYYANNTVDNWLATEQQILWKKSAADSK